tara:strand:- start:15095 stop:16021 length:927 start_codon:yes stop_codon:yes gene_type:complete
MLNFLYCFDENYNLQGLTSIYSVLTNLETPANFYIIHKSPESFNKYINRIKNHSKLNEINIYKFDKKKVKFPNLEEAHVSEATYYRLYIEEHIPKDITNLIYLDPDVVCLKNPEAKFIKIIDDLSNSDFVIAAHKEDLGQANTRFEDLRMKNNSYFNAGVMVIDFQKWLNQNLSKDLLTLLDEIEEKIKLWDQDVLNAYFDGEFIELGHELNFLNQYIQNINEQKLNEIYFLHFSGKYKPWTVKGVNILLGYIYHSNFQLATGKKYHIDNNWKKIALQDLLSIIFTGKIFKIKNPIAYLWYCIRYLLK